MNDSSLTGQPWRIGTVISVSPYKINVGGITYEAPHLFVNWIYELRDWKAETISLPSHPDAAFTETQGTIRFKQESLLSAGDKVAVLLEDDQTAYLIAKMVPA